MSTSLHKSVDMSSKYPKTCPHSQVNYRHPQSSAIQVRHLLLHGQTAEKSMPCQIRFGPCLGPRKSCTHRETRSERAVSCGVLLSQYFPFPRLFGLSAGCNPWRMFQLGIAKRQLGLRVFASLEKYGPTSWFLFTMTGAFLSFLFSSRVFEFAT